MLVILEGFFGVSFNMQGNTCFQVIGAMYMFVFNSPRV